jgi:hypothetical protein
MNTITNTARLAAAAVTAAALVAGGLLVASPAFAGQERTVLKTGETMKSGDSLSSSSQQYHLRMQPDGNLVEYGNGSGDGRVLWATGTAGNPGATLTIQADDNAVVRSSTGKALWSSGTSDRTQTKGYLTLGNDGQFNVLRSDRSLRWHNGAPGTDTLTTGRLRVGEYLHAGSAKLTFQGDRNLVATVGGKVVWSSHTGGSSAYRVDLQKDGNLVIVGSRDKVLWSSHTGQSYADRLVVSPNGALRLYSYSTVLWTAP